MLENSYLEISIQMIEQKLNWGASERWTASHFSMLSQEIFTKTGKTVSDSTLKRLFGKKDTSEHYTPQLYTRNAIAEYLGYGDWQKLVYEIKLKNHPKNLKSGKKIPHRTVLYLSLGITIFTVLIVSVLTQNSDGEKVWLKTADTARTVPFTAVFQYDVSGIGDSVFIDFGNNTSVPLPKEKHTITEFYKACGVFYPKIFTRKKVLDSIRIENYSRNWQGGYSPNDDCRMYTPFEDSTVYRQNGRLYISPENLKFQEPLFGKGIYAEYRFMNNFDVSLDSIDFSASVKNSPLEGGKLCYDVEIWLIGSENNCKVRFVEPECFRYGQFKVSEKEYNGRFDDLSALARDVKEWTDVRVHILNSQVNVYYNNSDVLTQSYKESMGKLIGIYFRFFGTGSLREVSVKNYQNTQIYSIHF